MQAGDETLCDRGCDQSDSEGSEAIYDCTGGKTIGVNIGVILSPGLCIKVFEIYSRTLLLFILV